VVKPGDMPTPMTREELEQKMDELARKYVETHDREIIEELYKLSLRLQELEKQLKAKPKR
jgi:site-specific recombinase XerC